MISVDSNKGIMTVHDVAAFLGKHASSAKRLLAELEAGGLKRKGRGRGTHYSRSEFEHHYAAYDTRP